MRAFRDSNPWGQKNLQRDAWGHDAGPGTLQCNTSEYMARGNGAFV